MCMVLASTLSRRILRKQHGRWARRRSTRVSLFAIAFQSKQLTASVYSEARILCIVGSVVGCVFVSYLTLCNMDLDFVLWEHLSDSALALYKVVHNLLE